MVFIAVYSSSPRSGDTTWYELQQPDRPQTFPVVGWLAGWLLVGCFFFELCPCCCGKIIIFHLCHHPGINTFCRAKEFNRPPDFSCPAAIQPTFHCMQCHSSDEHDEKVDKHKPYFAKALKTLPQPPPSSTCHAFDANEQQQHNKKSYNL